MTVFLVPLKAMFFFHSEQLPKPDIESQEFNQEKKLTCKPKGSIDINLLARGSKRSEKEIHRP